MKRKTLLLLAGVSILLTAALGSGIAKADDERGDTSILILAPILEADCTANTVSVLGLTVNIQAAEITGLGCDSGDGEDDDDQGDDDQQGDSDGSSHDSGGACAFTCADLVPGLTALLTLSDDTTFTATRIRLLGAGGHGDGSDGEDGHSDSGGGDGEERGFHFAPVFVQAPVQAVDTVAQTIQVLGLTVDASGAIVRGVDNEGDHDCGEQLGLGDVIVGQFVDVVLQSSAPPFAATFVLIRNFSNQVEISVQSPNGESLAGAQLAVHVIEKVVVRGRSRRVSRTLHFRMTTVGGPVRLAGLPTGRAKIEIQGIVGGEPSLGRRRIVVSPDRLVSTRVVLKPVRD